MLTTLAKKIINPIFSVSILRRFGTLLTKIDFQMSNKKSPQQMAYFQSRQATYNKHRYPHYKASISLAEFIRKYSDLKPIHKQNNKILIQDLKSKKQQFEISQSQQKQPIIQQVIGRISSIRKHGKTTFIDIREEHLRLQVTIRTEKELQIRRGDIIGVKGEPFVTMKGELSINCVNFEDLVLLAPCMWMLPQYEHLKDAQARFRNKPLDILTNSHSLEIIRKRAKAISVLRTQLQNLGYIEVQTPILSSSCGGAIAKPFITYHNDHKADLFLRIAPELYLKKLLVGGILRVFQIGKNFRNQSIDQTHNPQFTSCQLYCAYEDYQGMMKFTYKLINKIAVEVNGTPTIKCKNENGQVVEIDLSKKWKEVDFMTGLEEAIGIKLPIDFEKKETIQFYDKLCAKNHIVCEEPRSIERLLDKLAGRYLETTHQPFFIVNHPKVMSPLAKPIQGSPHLTQRFELFINGFEIINSYTELNDPRIQKENTPTDLDFVEALEYGLMPCAGWGMGIDRFIMLLTQNERIQEVIAFPLLREMFEKEKEK